MNNKWNCGARAFLTAVSVAMLFARTGDTEDIAEHALAGILIVACVIFLIEYVKADK